MSGPKGPLSRYAFGYSDEKPGVTFWSIHLVMVAYVVYQFWRLN